MRPFIVVALAAAIAGCATKEGKVEGETRGVKIGLRAPDYRARTLAGDSAILDAQKGKVVLLNVWATWCHPCRTEIPELLVIQQRYRARGLELVGVSVDSDGADEDIRAFMKDYKMDYTIWRDPDDHVSSLFYMVGVPATFLIDRQGILRWKTTGPIVPGDTTLAAAIEGALRGLK